MKYLEIIREAIAIGSAPSNVIDLRDPKGARGKRRLRDKKYVKPGESKYVYRRPEKTMVCLSKNKGVILYCWGNDNVIPWKEVLDRVSVERDPNFPECEITTFRTGFLIDKSKDFGQWSGNRNQYSDDVREIARALLDRMVGTLSTPIWVGNWASGEGEAIGTIGKIISKHDVPSRIIVYHGTSSLRLPKIMKDGLRPLDLEQRVWNKGGLEKNRPAHRDVCVYVTASRDQAEYYARQAVKIDRVRMGPNARYKANRAVYDSKDIIVRNENRIRWLSGLSPEEKTNHYNHENKYNYGRAIQPDHEVVILQQQIEKAKTIIEKYRWLLDVEQEGTVKPVLLTITLTKNDLKNLMADDDFLRITPDASPGDWVASLKNFSQIAYKGVIPPERIKIID